MTLLFWLQLHHWIIHQISLEHFDLVMTASAARWQISIKGNFVGQIVSTTVCLSASPVGTDWRFGVISGLLEFCFPVRSSLLFSVCLVLARNLMKYCRRNVTSSLVSRVCCTCV